MIYGIYYNGIIFNDKSDPIVLICNILNDKNRTYIKDYPVTLKDEKGYHHHIPSIHGMIPIDDSNKLEYAEYFI